MYQKAEFIFFVRVSRNFIDEKVHLYVLVSESNFCLNLIFAIESLSALTRIQKQF